MANPTYFPTIVNSICTGLVADGNGLITQAVCTGTLPTTANIFEVGCTIVQTDAVAGLNPVFTNTGTSALPVFTRSLTTNSTAVGINGLNVAHAIYSFAVDGGAVSTITPVSTAVIPNNAIIVAATINSTTAVTSAGSATVSVGTSAGSSTTSILGATAKASLSLDALINGVPIFATPVKMTAAGNVTFSVATAALTAGVIEAFVYYTVA
ncbi:MAG: hypothetical protein ABIQ91_01500, partial [Candidatus Paceibacterota bacterium]